MQRYFFHIEMICLINIKKLSKNAISQQDMHSSLMHPIKDACTTDKYVMGETRDYPSLEYTRKNICQHPAYRETRYTPWKQPVLLEFLLNVTIKPCYTQSD